METIFLESWLHDHIRRESQTNSEFRQFLGVRPSEGFTRADVERYQLFRLREMLAYVHEHSSFYGVLFNSNGLRPNDIKSLSDLSRIPFTDQTDLALNPNRFLCVSHGEIARATTFTSSGTTGPEKRVFCTEGDIEKIVEFMGAGMKTVTHEGDVVQILLPSGSVNNQAELLARGIERIGGVPVIAGLKRSADEQLDMIKKHRPSIIFGVTPMIYRITQELRDKCSLSELGVKTLFLTSGYVSRHLRENLKNLWQCDIHDHYGLTEMGLAVAVECHAHDGYHCNEVDLLCEVIDPKSGRALGEGEGELVFTTLRREGMPLIRYRTNDIVRLIREQCPCNATTLMRFGDVSRRLELEVALLSGHVIYPSMFDEVLYRLTDLVDYELRVKDENGKDRLCFTVEMRGPKPGLRNIIKQLLYSDPLLSSALSSKTVAEPEIFVVPSGYLLRGGRVKKKIVDERVLRVQRESA